MKRTGIFLLCFIVLGFAAFTVAGAIVGAIAGQSAGNAQAGYQSGKAAAEAFSLRHGILLWLGVLIVSAGIAFRWRGAALAAVLALGIYLFAPQGLAIHRRWFPKAAPERPAGPKTLVGRRMALTVPITVDLPYGTAQIARGTVVEVIAEEGYVATVRVPGGFTTRVPRARLK